jgi:hypothetical protein
MVPNPATNHVDITLSNYSVASNSAQAELVIYDMSGKVMLSSGLTVDETKRVDLNGFSAGVYIIKVMDNGMLISTEKLIVQ